MLHKSNIVFYTFLSYISGVFVGSFIDVNTRTILIIVVCVIVASLWLIQSKKYWVLFVVYSIFLALGLLHIQYAQKYSLITEVINKDDTYESIEMSGYISRDPEHRIKNQRFVFRANHISYNTNNYDVDERILVSTRSHPQYRFGQELQITGRLQTPTTYGDSSFDYGAYLAKDEIYTVVYYPQSIEIVSDINIGVAQQTKKYLWKMIFTIKSRFESTINKLIPEPNAAFINGILLGSRSGFTDQLKEDFKSTGTTHILAISGYNITIVSSIIMAVLVRFMMRRRAFWLTIVGVAIFTIMVGAEASVVRAAIMGVFVLIAKQSGRVSSSHIALTITAFLMLAQNPLLLRYDIGFQLSFMATLGLLYGVPVLESYFKKLPSLFGFRETVVMTISAQLFVLPLLLYHFGMVSTLSLPVNILVLPFIPYAMLLGFATGLFGMFFPVLGMVIASVAWFISSIDLWIIQGAARIPNMALMISIPWYIVFIMYGVILSGVYYIKKQRTNYDL